MKGLRSLLGAVLALLCVSAAPALAAQASGCLPITSPAPISGVAYTQLINAQLAGLGSTNSGVTAPGNCGGLPVLGMRWLDTSTNSIAWLRIYDGTNWLGMAALDTNNHIYEAPIGGGVATLSAAAVTDLCGTPESSISIVGGTTIASFGTSCAIGQVKLVTFASVLALAYDPSAIILPTAASITTQAGDSAALNYVGGGVWRVFGYQRADGTPLSMSPSHYAGQSITMRTPSCPSGSLPEDGRSLSKTTYPQLTAAIGTTWGGSGTTINLPDTRGYFERGWGAGQTVDAGRGFGNIQGDTVGAHNHAFSVANVSVYSNLSVSVSVPYSYSVTNISNGVSGTSYGRADSNSTVNSTASGSGSAQGYGYGSGSGTTELNNNYGPETRPKNITGYHCIFTSTF